MAGEKTVLVADDSAFVRKVIASHLEGTEFTVVGEVASGLEVLHKFSSLHPDIVLLDVIMPDRSGTEALALLMKAHPDAKAIMLSSMGSEEIVEKCLAGGARTFLQKPFAKEDLLAQLRKVAATS